MYMLKVIILAMLYVMIGTTLGILWIAWGEREPTTEDDRSAIAAVGIAMTFCWPLFLVVIAMFFILGNILKWYYNFANWVINKARK